MTSAFSIEIDWISADHGPEEVRHTSALLQIALDNHVVTHVDDDWSKSVHDKVRLSVYPLALWLASSWWRLRWEPAPSGRPDLGWRMAHEVAAAGYGFLWPRLLFMSDGESVDVVCRATGSEFTEPVRYLDDYRALVPASVFERTVDEFLDLVIARLGAVGVGDTQLHSLWREVRAERKDPGTSLYRRLEAGLGFEPDEAPETIVKRLKDLSTEAGSAAANEIAPVCSGKDPAAALERVMQFAASSGVAARITCPDTLRRTAADPVYQGSAPWERGRLLARAARDAWGIGDDSVKDDVLSEILGVTANVIQQPDAAHHGSPLGLAIRSETDQLRVLFRKRNRAGRRFEAARFLGDHSSAPADDRWLPATDSRTARQKLQRAFAAEFLCPVQALQALLDGDYSTHAIEDAAEHFSVSPLAVRSHLALNGLLPLFDKDPVPCEEA